MGENPCQLVIQETIEDQSIQGDKNKTKQGKQNKKTLKNQLILKWAMELNRKLSEET